MDIPVTLVAPDGREHVAKTHAEANQLLLGRGYRVQQSQVDPAPAAEEPKPRKTRQAPDPAELTEPVVPEQSAE